MTSFFVQRFPFAASAESGPSGRYSSKLLTCTSGTFANVLLVIPCFVDERFAVQVHPHPVALQHHDQFGELRATMADEVRRALQCHRQNRTSARAIPITEPAGHPAGFASNTASARPLQRRQTRRKRFREFHPDVRDIRLRATRERQPHIQARPIRPGSLRGRVRLERRAEVQPSAAGDREGGGHVGCDPCAPLIVAVTCCRAQSVGLKMNPGRSIVTFAVRNRRGIPSITCGKGSLVTVNAAVTGSTWTWRGQQRCRG